ncbi:hypothetical protein [uncultured Bacteroides sp.]|uniref:hypothetical protein n=1 Tax=uncultured Bacteroides sp. TaxID=162156 RepID=UPI002AABA847|nr:hypothetical protein [uncultured Bacteroides sp.]
MKKKVIISALFALFALMATIGCKDETDSPKELILGKWELIAFGNSWTNMYTVIPTGFVEYLPDNTIKHYSYETHKYDTVIDTYHIDSLLHVGSISHEYRFYKDIMELRIVNVLAEFNNFRYKRVK